jgi:hypothetical protein
MLILSTGFLFLSFLAKTAHFQTNAIIQDGQLCIGLASLEKRLLFKASFSRGQMLTPST